MKYKLILTILLVISISATFYWQKVNSPTTAIPGFVNADCTQDNQCPPGYKCQTLIGSSTVCPANNPQITCQPSNKVLKGQCRLVAGQTCQTSNDCYAGLICHSNTCAQPALGSCSPGLNNCPTGYSCVQGCGGPVARSDNPPPGYYCLINELATKPRMCPICLSTSTAIDTPTGPVNVTQLVLGTSVWTINSAGHRVIGTILQLTKTPVPPTHQVLDLHLADGRHLLVSPGHPTTSGPPVNQLKVGDHYSDSTVTSTQLTPYTDSYTYDLLPSGETGFYWANGILMASTLK